MELSSAAYFNTITKITHPVCDFQIVSYINIDYNAGMIMKERELPDFIIQPPITEQIFEIFRGVDLMQEGSFRIGQDLFETKYDPGTNEYRHTCMRKDCLLAIYTHIDDQLKKESYWLFKQLPNGRNLALACRCIEGKRDKIYSVIFKLS